MLPARRKASAGTYRAALALAGVVAYGLVTLRTELTRVANLNDTSLHASMVRWAQRRIEDGHTPFDGWYPYLGMGVPQFHHYQSFPHIVGGLVATAFGPDRTVAWTLYLLLATWPISVYAGTRLMGWDWWAAVVAAAASPLLVSITNYGYEQGSYTWQGFGTWSQLWAMWLLPIALGLSWRAIAGTRTALVPAAIAVALVLGCHVLTGYLALLCLVAFAILSWTRLAQRVVRAVCVGAGALAGSAWLLLPALIDQPWANYAGYERGSFYYDSFGASRVLRWLVSGSLYDEGRFPVVTILVAIGVVVCATRARREERARATLAIWGVSLLLFFGRPTLGVALEVLPGNDDLFLHRYILGVHLGGLLLAGVGGAWLGRQLLALLPRFGFFTRRQWFAPAAVVVATFVFLVPGYRERASAAGHGSDLIEGQQLADRGDGAALRGLIDDVKRRRDGRTYAGMPFNWGRQYRIGSVPVYSELLNNDVDALGFTLRVPSLSTGVEVLFDETNPAHYTIFDVRYLLLPQDRQPSVPATLLRARGRHRLWQVEAPGGYVQAVDRAPPIVADRATLATDVTPFLGAVDSATRRPTVAFASAHAHAATQGGDDAPGAVTPLAYAPDRGTFAARALMRRPGSVVLAASFHPRWRVTVDGEEAPLELVAPSFVGVAVDAGEHSIVFRYEPFPYTLPLLLAGAFVLLALWFASRRVRWLYPSDRERPLE